MTNRQAIRLIWIALISSLILSAQDISTNTITISIDPTETLTDLYFLYAQGDVSRYEPLSGTAPGGVNTQFTINADIPFDIPGAPFFSVIGIYSTSGGAINVDVALDATDAANLPDTTTFADAFPSFSPSFLPLTETNLGEAMEDTNSVVPVSNGGALLGFDILDIFADTPEQQTPPLFAPLNATGTSDASLVMFSDAAPGGSVEVSIQPAGEAAVPEPVSSWLPGAVVLALSVKRFRGELHDK